jgi:hypothetical protein
VETLIDALVKTPLPTILVVAGIVFLFLAVGGQLGARFSSEHLKPLYAFVLGLILLGTGVWMHVIQGREINKGKLVNAQASPTPTLASPTATPPSSTSGRGVMGPLLSEIQLKGGNLSQTPISVASAEECSDECAKREDCAAMTFVKGAGDCWLKNAVPPQLPNPKMVSAIKKQ